METPKLVCDETKFGSESHTYSEPKFESEILMCTEQSLESPTRLVVCTDRCLESASLEHSEEQCSQSGTLPFQKSEPASIVCKELGSELNTIVSTERVFEPASFVGTEQALELALLHYTDQTIDSPPENRKPSEEDRISIRSQAGSSVASFPEVVAQEVVIVESSHVSVPAARDLGMLKDDRVLRNLLISEDKCPANPVSYFMFQEDIKPFMRRIVSMWMLEVCSELKREEEVLPMAVNYLDRVLSVIQLQRTQLQLVASVCLFIASKLKECDPITAQQLIAYTDYSITVQDVMDWELIILQLLKWDTNVVLPQDFMEHILHRLPVKEEDKERLLRHATTFAAVCVTEHGMCVHPPSVLAASCLSAAAYGILGNRWCQGAWFDRLHQITAIDVDCIKACHEQIEKLIESRMKSDPTSDYRTDQRDDTDECASSSQKSYDNESTVYAATPTDVRDIRLDN